MLCNKELLTHATTWMNLKSIKWKKPDRKLQFHSYEVLEKSKTIVTESISVVARNQQ